MSSISSYNYGKRDSPALDFEIPVPLTFFAIHTVG